MSRQIIDRALQQLQRAHDSLYPGQGQARDALAMAECFLEEVRLSLTTVADLVKDNFGERAMDNPCNTFLNDIPAESNVGKAARECIRAAIVFSASLDPHPEVKKHVYLAVIEHIRILYR